MPEEDRTLIVETINYFISWLSVQWTGDPQSRDKQDKKEMSLIEVPEISCVETTRDCQYICWNDIRQLQ